MKKIFSILILGALPLLALAGGKHAGGHDDDHAMAYGVPGEAAQVSRTIEVQAADNMRYTPAAITVRRGEPWLQPWHDPYAGLVYAARGLDVQDVWVEGRQLVAAGALLASDADEAVKRAERWAARLRQNWPPESILSPTVNSGGNRSAHAEMQAF